MAANAIPPQFAAILREEGISLSCRNKLAAEFAKVKSDMLTEAKACLELARAQAQSPIEALPSETLAEMERRVILNTYFSADGNYLAVCTSLGIGRTTLHRRLRKYDISVGVEGSVRKMQKKRRLEKNKQNLMGRIDSLQGKLARLESQIEVMA